VTDHAKYSFHGSERVEVEAPRFWQNTVRALQYGTGGRVVGVDGLHAPKDDAAQLADLVERLADATPEQHRQLAAAIREAAVVAGGAL
jgi:hypothetical protein